MWLDRTGRIGFRCEPWFPAFIQHLVKECKGKGGLSSYQVTQAELIELALEKWAKSQKIDAKKFRDKWIEKNK